MKLPLSHRHVPLLSTAAVCLLLYAVCAMRYPHFFSLEVFLNFFRNNAPLGIVAVGMTFVILSGGIDLSVGSVVACSGILAAALMEKAGVPPPVAIVLVLAGGAAFGLLMGCTIRYLGLPPFIATLAGMFLARGLGFMASLSALTIRNGLYRAASQWGIEIGRAQASLATLAFLAVLAAGVYLATWTAFGRNVYAVGGSEDAALLMGVPVGRTKLAVYALSGLCAALAGIVATLSKSSGDPRAAFGLELEAIATVVIGGTLLTGGVGYVFGTLLGFLIFGIIDEGIRSEGTLNSSWTRVAVGVLLLLFILLQKLVARTGLRGAR